MTRSFDVFSDQRLNKPLSKQSQGWWLETPSGLLWRHCNAQGDVSVTVAKCNHLVVQLCGLYPGCLVLAGNALFMSTLLRFPYDIIEPEDRHVDLFYRHKVLKVSKRQPQSPSVKIKQSMQQTTFYYCYLGNNLWHACWQSDLNNNVNMIWNDIHQSNIWLTTLFHHFFKYEVVIKNKGAIKSSYFLHQLYHEADSMATEVV